MDGERNHEGRGLCPPCDVFMEGEKAETCAFFKGYLTDEEVQILSILRGLKEKAREVRREMRRLHQELDVELFARPEEDLTPSERRRRRAQEALHRQWRECARQLDELRQQWREWEQMRWEAHHRKMVLLGHRPWGSRPEIP